MKKKQAFYRWIFKFVALHDVDAQNSEVIKIVLSSYGAATPPSLSQF